MLSSKEIHRLWSEVVQAKTVDDAEPVLRSMLTNPSQSLHAAGLLLRHYLNAHSWDRLGNLLLTEQSTIALEVAKELKSLLDLSSSVPPLAPLLPVFVKVLDRAQIDAGTSRKSGVVSEDPNGHFIVETAVRAIAHIAEQGGAIAGARSPLAALLNRKQKRTRRYAATALTHLAVAEQDQQVIRKLLLADERRDVRVGAAAALGITVDRSSAMAQRHSLLLTEALGDADRRVADQAALSIVKLIEELKPIVDKVRLAADVRQRVQRLVSQGETGGRRRLDALCGQLATVIQSEDELAWRLKAWPGLSPAEKLELLIRLQRSRYHGLDISHWHPHLKQLCRLEQDDLARRATQILIYDLVDRQRWDEIGNLLSNADNRVIHAGLEALHVAGMQSDITPLVPLIADLRHTTEPEVAQTAQDAVDGLTLMGRSDLSSVVETYAQDLNSADAQVRLRAAQYLVVAAMRGADIGAAFVPLLQRIGDPDPLVARKAAQALIQLVGAEPEASP
jgi:hypothetical protein